MAVFNLRANSALVAFTWTQTLKMQNAIVESDNKILIEACKRVKLHWEVSRVVTDIMDCCEGLQQVKFSKIDRKLNGCAHSVAAKWCKGTLSKDWVSNILQI